jgi:hypothetical protein
LTRPRAAHLGRRADAHRAGQPAGGARLGERREDVRAGAPDRAYPPGWYVVHGRFRLTVAPDGTRDFPRPRTRTENLCATPA